MLYPLVALLESPGAGHGTGALLAADGGPYPHLKASGLWVKGQPCRGGDFELTPRPPLSAGPQRSGVSGVAKHDACRTHLSHLHQLAAFPPGSAVVLRIPAARFRMQTQTMRGYPAPDQRRVLGRLRTCRTKG